MVGRSELADVSLKVWDFIDDCDQAGFSPREETITEQIILWLSQMTDSRVFKSSVPDEALHGYDLRWSIRISKNKWYDLVIQAKKLARFSPRNQGYEDLSRNRSKCSKALIQCDKLLKHASTLNATRPNGAPHSIAMHMFYHGKHIPWNSPSIPAAYCRGGECFRVHDPFDITAAGVLTPLGATLCPTSFIKSELSHRLQKGKGYLIHPKDLNPHNFPVECLTCTSCPTINGQPFGGSGTEPAGNKPPQWVISLLHGDDSGWNAIVRENQRPTVPPRSEAPDDVLEEWGARTPSYYLATDLSGLNFTDITGTAETR